MFTSLKTNISFFALSSLIFLSPLNSNAQTTPQESKTYTLKWAIAHGPYDLIKKAVEQFKDNVEKRTNQKVKVVIDKKNDLALHRLDHNPNRKSLIDLIDGKVQMAQIYTFNSAKYNPLLNVLDLPFIFDNDEHVFKVLDGPIGKELADGLLKESKVMRSLAYTYCGGFRVIPARIPVNTLEDFSKLKLAYPAIPVLKETYNQLKIETYATSFQESLTNLKEKNINGYLSTYARFGYSRESKHVKYVNYARFSVLISGLIINEHFFQSLPKEFQQIIQEEAHKAALIEREESIRIGNEILASAPEKNIEVVAMPAKEIERLKEATLPVYKKFENIFGKQLIKGIQSQRP